MPSCLGREFGEVVLRDIELDLNVVQISQRDDRARGPPSAPLAN